jgi:hypothetical protein
VKPSQVSASLRRIASGIQASSKPDPVLVARDLRRVLAGVLEELGTHKDVYLNEGSVEYFPGDDRSMGTLEYEFQVGDATVSFFGEFSDGSGFETNWKINGKPASPHASEVLDQTFGYDDIENQPPHDEAAFYGPEEDGQPEAEVFAKSRAYEKALPRKLKNSLKNNDVFLKQLIEDIGISEVVEG